MKHLAKRVLGVLTALALGFTLTVPVIASDTGMSTASHFWTKWSGSL